MSGKSPSCTVLLCTYNGAAYLDQQLRSLAAQTVPVLNVYASDDGSKDQTHEILRNWQQNRRKGDFVIEKGPRRGFAENFRSLMLRAPENDFSAFCDQDDVWHPDKLESAMLRLAGLTDDACLYGGRSVLVDGDGEPIGLPPLFLRPPDVKNALVQSLAAGNTMVLNRPGFVLLAESARRTQFLMHDWWAYLLVSGAGGRVIYDPIPHIDYRQHGKNALGGRIGLAKRPKRLLELLGGKYTIWNDANVQALDRCSDLLSPHALDCLAAFKSLRTAGNAVSSIIRLMRSGIYRQTRKGDLALVAAAILRRL
ncbi:glycosyltransferase family 2 protein [uncultured Devosia sp.]|uniref:glycosyltransferase family 2 protein n=1 Tax=uncultured Devosia sp. TaxID=211434 RepID=UPI0035CCA179